LANIKIRRGGKEVPFFGNPELWKSDERPSRWLDTAAEEYFRKLWGLTSVRSRNFRVYIVGETLADSGTPVARAHRVVEFSVEPARENDAIKSQKINIIHEKNL
jgi:hypothetical protein